MENTHILQKSIERNLIDLLNEAEEAKNDITRLESKVNSLLARGEESVITCTVVTGEVDIKSRFRDVNKELNEIDEKLTIIWATIATHSRYSSTMMGMRRCS